MHGVPEDLDLSAFVGHSVSMLSVDWFQIQVSFSAPAGADDVSRKWPGHLGIVGTWELHGPQGELIDHRLNPEADRDVYRIHKLLQREVVGWRLLPPNTFELSFSGGYALRVIDDDPRFEFCSIRLPGDSGGGWFL